ncbi:WD40/YVTN repeat-like-containing domain [Phytophthora cinnamomi]|uniref:WD40/YVTN repeat-like-containing domain n=1 Tax=Phytophthora cinnamomi TaxID=4785 RepID=UPI003559AF88|nr:WD40/YVTN repeat-like-containing domain [Phytophthora cinnamomi]
MSTVSSSSSPASPPPAATPPVETVPAAAAADADSENSFWDIIAQSHPNLESYSDQEMDVSMSDFPTLISTSMTPTTALTGASPLHDSIPEIFGDMPSYSSLARPNHYVTVGTRQDGSPFPLSKPILREDGILLVGTEIVADPSSPNHEKNRIFVANVLTSSGATQPMSHIEVEEDIRDLHWVDSQIAVVAVGKEIQLIQLADPSVGGIVIANPISCVHSDTIRELAVSATTASHVLSGGFDETVVVTDLRSTADPKASTVIAKYDARDVVSSVRWSPAGASQVSWTTDGGDFQVADSRVPSPQLQVPLHKYLHVGKLGGLFAHEYLSDFSVALGFESGYVAMLDLRLPRHSFCTSLVESRLTAIGEIRRSGTKLAMFGRSGFSTAQLTATADSIDHITRQQPTQIAATSYKTSGDFSFESGAHLAVSDNMGIVSVYTDNNIFGSGSSGW